MSVSPDTRRQIAIWVTPMTSHNLSLLTGRTSEDSGALRTVGIGSGGALMHA